MILCHKLRLFRALAIDIYKSNSVVADNLPRLGGDAVSPQKPGDPHLAQQLADALASMKIMEAELKSLKDDSSEKPTLKRATPLTVASSPPVEAC